MLKWKTVLFKYLKTCIIEINYNKKIVFEKEKTRFRKV